MANTVLFIVTNAGRQALASTVTLSHVVVGAGKYEPLGTETALVDERARTQIVSGGVESISEVLRFSTVIHSDQPATITEVGLLTDDGTLFAVASSVDDAFFTSSSTAGFIASFGIPLAGLASQNVRVDSSDDNQPLSLTESHLQNTNAHEQYLHLPRFQSLLDAVIPIGYLYHSHVLINPKVFFDELLGIPTYWRRLTGKIVVGTDSTDRFIRSDRFVLGQQGMTAAAISQRPSVYPLQAAHMWERIQPYDVLYDGKHNYDGTANYQ